MRLLRNCKPASANSDLHGHSDYRFLVLLPVVALSEMLLAANQWLKMACTNQPGLASTVTTQLYLPEIIFDTHRMTPTLT